jgi:hypothetical protein
MLSIGTTRNLQLSSVLVGAGLAPCAPVRRGGRRAASRLVRLETHACRSVIPNPFAVVANGVRDLLFALHFWSAARLLRPGRFCGAVRLADPGFPAVTGEAGARRRFAETRVSLGALFLRPSHARYLFPEGQFTK